MRHKRVEKKFGRSMSHREQLMASLVVNLILRGRIRTTLPKAKQAKRDAEKIVTLARKGTLAARRLAAARLRRPEAVAQLFEKVVPSLDGRKGGYTRIYKLGQRRGDAASMAIIEWVSNPAPAAAAETSEAGKTAAVPAGKKTAEAKA